MKSINDHLLHSLVGETFMCIFSRELLEVDFVYDDGSILLKNKYRQRATVALRDEKQLYEDYEKVDQ